MMPHHVAWQLLLFNKSTASYISSVLPVAVSLGASLAHRHIYGVKVMSCLTTSNSEILSMAPSFFQLDKPKIQGAEPHKETWSSSIVQRVDQTREGPSCPWKIHRQGQQNHSQRPGFKSQLFQLLYGLGQVAQLLCALISSTLIIP